MQSIFHKPIIIISDLLRTLINLGSTMQINSSNVLAFIIINFGISNCNAFVEDINDQCQCTYRF